MMNKFTKETREIMNEFTKETREMMNEGTLVVKSSKADSRGGG